MTSDAANGSHKRPIKKAVTNGEYYPVLQWKDCKPWHPNLKFFFFFQLVYSLEYRASEIKSALKYKEISQSGHVHTKASLESTRFSVFWHV